MRVEILQVNSSGLAVSLKTKIFGLRVPQEEIFTFYLRITITFKWAYYQIGIYFSEVNCISDYQRYCFKVHIILNISKEILPD